MLYNDAYAVILGDKHPAALGSRGRTRYLAAGLVWPGPGVGLVTA